MATLESLKEIVNIVLANANKPTTATLEGGMSLREDLGMTSLDLAEFTVRVEDAYGVDIFKQGVVDRVDEVLGRIQQ